MGPFLVTFCLMKVWWSYLSHDMFIRPYLTNLLNKIKLYKRNNNYYCNVWWNEWVGHCTNKHCGLKIPSTWHFLSSRMLKMCDLMFLVLYFLFVWISLIINWFYHNYENYTCDSWNQNYFNFSPGFFHQIPWSCNIYHWQGSSSMA